jgi:pimeloyl-ACP methyl ester carboxylesterase
MRVSEKLATTLWVGFCLAALIASGDAQTLPLQPGREHVPGAEVFRSWVTAPDGSKLRVFITRPANATGKLPVVFMVGWLSCDSVEQIKGPEDGFTQLLYDVAGHSGMATVRLDKPGTGESGGPKCSEADFNTELAGYRAAFAALPQIDFVDSSRVYILGYSNGGGYAPMVAQDKPVRGYLVFSGWYKTWLEHMLEHERRRMALAGISADEINRRMRGYATFYDRYLNGRQTPGQVIGAKPDLKAIWYDKPETQYGRPAAFYQQLQALNLAAEWSRVQTAVLAVHGEYDWIMSADDFRLLVRDLNARHAGSAEFIEWPRTDHNLYTHASPELAFRTDKNQRYDPKLTEYVLGWLKHHP